jgi:REP element-mobilizing transposase RayT
MNGAPAKPASHPGMPRIEEEGGYYFVNFSLLREDDKLTPQEREAVFAVIRQGDRNRYSLHAVVVMPTHVHLILQAIVEDNPVPLPKITHHIKGFSALKVNRLRGGKGALWLPRSHNRLLITDHEYRQKLKYIYENPRRGKLVKDPENYPFLWYLGKVEDKEPG